MIARCNRSLLDTLREFAEYHKTLQIGHLKMSYDLYFCVPKGRKGLSEKDFRRHFDKRPNYKKAPRQAWYENPETGVYFSFEYGTLTDEGWRPPPDLQPANVSFNLNYMRPHPFALEAEPEIAALVSTFDLLVDDPQLDGMGSGTYLAEGFIRGWNAGNRFSCHAPDESERARLLERAVPSEDLDLAWRWNFSRPSLDATLERRDVFVPTVAFVRLSSGTVPVVIWGDGVAIAIPPVKYLVLGRDKFSPAGLDWSVVPLEAAAAVLGIGESIQDHPVPFTLLDWDRPPSDVEQFFRSMVPIAGKPQFMPFDQTLPLEHLSQP